MATAPKTTPLRSLHVFGSLATGGSETWFLRLLASRPPRSDWSADVCLLDPKPGPYVERAKELGARILECPARPAASFPTRLVELLREERPDAIHSHVLLFGGVIAAAAAAAGAPVRAVHSHNSRDGREDGLKRRLYRQAMRSAIGRFANLRLACSSAAALVWDAETEVFPYGLDLTAPAPPASDPRAEFGLTPDHIVLGHVGRMHPQKNQLFLLDSFREALRLEPRLRLLLVGEGDLAGALRERIRQLDMEDSVILAGRRGDVPQLMASVFDAFVMPSLYEGLPVALLEAQAAGLPCLVSDLISSETFAISELIRPLSLQQSWPDALAELVGKTPRIPSEQAARRLRAQGFAIDESWQRLTALYDRTLERRTPAAEAA